VLFSCSFFDKGSDYMPYGVSQKQWDSMDDYGRHLAKQAYEKKQGTTQTGSTTSTATSTTPSYPAGTDDPQKEWDWALDYVRRNSGAGAAMPSPEAPEQPIAAEQPIVQQPTFDPYDYIRELQEAQRQQQIAAIQAAQQRALSGLESTYTGRQGALGRALSSSETNLETGLQRTLSALDTEHAKIDPYYYDARHRLNRRLILES
jgi:hypothetical protein